LQHRGIGSNFLRNRPMQRAAPFHQFVVWIHVLRE
jgi:hypothetical protein